MPLSACSMRHGIPPFPSVHTGSDQDGGTLSFIRAIKAWPPNDKLVQCDVEKCFELLDHCLLLSFLNESCGEENQGRAHLKDLMWI
jgi:hypothetical protein